MPRFYTIVVAHALDKTWKEWFDDLNVIPAEDGTTLLTGILDDSAVLFSILNKIRNLNMDLLSVSFIEIPENQDGIQ